MKLRNGRIPENFQRSTLNVHPLSWAVIISVEPAGSPASLRNQTPPMVIP